MNNKPDINHLQDVKKLVDDFYARIRTDDLLSPVFEERIQDRWPEHLEKMYQFWQTILLEENTYKGRPFPPHATLNINENHFNRWVALFKATVDEHFSGEKAEEAKWRADKMSELFQIKRSHFNIG